MTFEMNALSASVIAFGAVAGAKTGGGVGLLVGSILDDWSFVAIGILVGAVTGITVAGTSVKELSAFTAQGEALVRRLDKKINQAPKSPVQMTAEGGRLVVFIP